MESAPRPLDDIVVDHLMAQSSETAELDFKYLINLRKNSEFVLIAEDIFAMSNYGGGFIFFGFRERETGSYEKKGLPKDYHIDQANIQEKFNSYSNEPIELLYREFNRKITEKAITEDRKFAVLYIPPSRVILYPIKDGEYQDKQKKQKFAFKSKDILIRRGTVTDKATPVEIEYINDRIDNRDYEINVLSGEPDTINENIYSNLFKLVDLPFNIYSRNRYLLPDSLMDIINERKIIYHMDRDNLYTFDARIIDIINDCTKTDFLTYVKKDYGFNVCKILMNMTLNIHMNNIGLYNDYKYNNSYYFGSHGGDKYVYWKGRYKKGKRYVVKYRYINKLQKSLYLHEGVDARFISINKQFYLILVSRLILSEDGLNSIHSFEQGRIITSLVHDQYNDKYLNNVLFWITKINVDDQEIVDIGNNIKFESIPQIYSLSKGIRADRPSTEFKNRKDELYAIMELK